MKYGTSNRATIMADGQEDCRSPLRNNTNLNVNPHSKPASEVNLADTQIIDSLLLCAAHLGAHLTVIYNPSEVSIDIYIIPAPEGYFPKLNDNGSFTAPCIPVKMVVGFGFEELVHDATDAWGICETNFRVNYYFADEVARSLMELADINVSTEAASEEHLVTRVLTQLRSTLADCIESGDTFTVELDARVRGADEESAPLVASTLH